MGTRVKYLVLGIIFLPIFVSASVRDLSSTQMLEIVRLARLIAFSQPNLHSTKYFEYAYGILMAAQKYDIDPILLIAITHQETSFRENLPEGKAGEIGICQIRKHWIRNLFFVREFGRVKIQDFKNPIKSFSYAAWILRDLKTIERPSRTLPYWCYYNSKTFNHRLKYFLAVNQGLVRLRKADPELMDRSLASVKNLARNRAKLIAKAKLQSRQASLAD